MTDSKISITTLHGRDLNKYNKTTEIDRVDF